MKYPLSLLISSRFSKGRRRGGMVSLISFLSTVGIALGVMVLIVGLSAMNGFERELNNRILSVVPHGEVEPLNQPFIDWPSAMNAAKRVKGIDAVAPYINFTGLIESGTKLQALQIKGVNPSLEPAISAIPKFIDKDNWQKFTSGKQQIILGGGLANSLHVGLGDWISVMVPNFSDDKRLLQPKRIRLQVSGILQLSGILDHSLGLVPLNDAQIYLGMQDSVTGIALKMSNPFDAQILVSRVAQQIGLAVHVHSWIDRYGYMYRDIQMIRAIMYLAMVLVIGVACFNIVSTLIMAVKEKSTDIAVLRTQGAKDALIRAAFFWYGLQAGLLGSILGAISGVLISINLECLIDFLSNLIGREIISGDVYFVNFIPSELHYSDVVLVLLTANILSLLASWYPARRACNLNPSRVLSGK